MYITLLREFIVPVPVCTRTIRLIELLELFERGECEKVVVVNEQHEPLGVVNFTNVMPYLIIKNELLHSKKQVQELKLHLQQPLAELHASLIQPLAVLPASLNFNEFCLQILQAQPPVTVSSWALVNLTGEFLGLLDTLGLQKFLIGRSTLSSLEMSGVETKESFHRGSVTSTNQTTPALQNSINLLVQLLEQLPLPLMLQTGTGRVIAQNTIWQQQVGELQDPSWIRQAASPLLESVNASLTQSSPRFDQRQSVQAGPARETAAEIAIAASARPPNSCQLSSEPNTCICTCSMKNGPERVWQFTITSFDLGLCEAAPSGYASTLFPFQVSRSLPQVSAENFQLAALEPDAAISLGVKPLQELPQSLSDIAVGEKLWLVLAQDKTEQQQVARELTAKNADLIQLNRLKDEFLSCISHELKTPLTAVLGLSSLLKERVVGELNERQARYARLVHQSGRHLMTIVNDILDLTRMETGQLELTLEPVSIAAVCDRSYQQALQAQQLSEAPDDRGLAVMQRQFKLEIEPGLESIHADEARLRQMLVNLLSNALKFTDIEGELGLRVSPWGGWVAFTVWDTGIGIPVEKQHLIFQKFQQLENPLTRRFEGTGLGLVLTQRLARLHGGDVTFTSREGQGSQFTLLLPPSPPRWQAEKEAGGAGEVTAIPWPLIWSSNRLVLIVEAVPQYIEELQAQLTSLGYRVAIARAGTEALEKARRLQPCVVLLNPVLPLLSGWDVLTLLKSDSETRDVPVVITATRAEKEQAEQNQADGFLSLPVQIKALQQTIARLTPQPSSTLPAQDSLTRLTILLLSSSSQQLSKLSELLQLHHHHILEVDDLEQAELMARVWKPHVVILDAEVADPPTYLRQLGQQSFLMSLPLVTLTQEATQVANQIVGLSVFPCLVPPETKLAAPLGQTHSALLQVIQVAAGMSWKPCILVVDAIALTDDTTQPENAVEPSAARYPQGVVLQASSGQVGSEWLQALIQYVQAAGFRGLVGHSWPEVLRQLQYQSVDLLLLCLRDDPLHPEAYHQTQLTLRQALLALAQMEDKPPIVVLDYRQSQVAEPLTHTGRGDAHLSSQTSRDLQELTTLLQTVSNRMLPASLSMQELLEQLRQALTHRSKR